MLESGRDPNQLIREIQAQVDDEVRQALAAMDFKQDCADRVATHFHRLNGHLQKMVAILEAVNVDKDLEPALKAQLTEWMGKNLESHRKLVETAGKMKATAVPQIPANITTPRLRQRFEAQRTQLINMKKTYAASLPAIEANERLLARGSQLLGAKPPATKTATQDPEQKRVYDDARRQIEALNKDF
jgi:hypothetical protein